MKKSTKVMSLTLSALLAFGGLTSLTACGGDTVKSEATEIVIKVREAGFGTDWLYELEGRFEEAYKAQNYKVKILTPNNSIKDDVVVKELALGYDEVGVDLYITSGILPDMVGELGDYGVLAEDITDSVYNKPAISYSGAEESKTVLQKVSSDVIPYMTDSKGVTYSYCWAQTSAGLVINTKKLEKYGLEYPKTTNEMFDCFEKIYCGTNGIGNSIKTETYPITYVSGGSGYGLCFLYTLLAQYEEGFFDKFWSFQTTDEDGNVEKLSDAECKAIYNDPTVLEMLKIAYRTFDVNISAPGSLSQSVDQAQAKIMDEMEDDAVFMFNGDWMLNEVKMHYGDKLNDIDFINFPVMSALGTKLFGAGTSYNLSDAKCDELLSYIIELVDQNKELDEIVDAVEEEMNITIDEDDAAEVARARGVTYSRGVEHVAYVTKGTPKKDIVSLFLRMMSSDDFGKTFNNTANGTSPYYAQENTTSEYEFVRNASKIPANKYFSLISTVGGARGYREQLNLNAFFTIKSHIPDYISSSSGASIYTDAGTKNGNSVDVYVTAAQNLIKEETANITKNWETYLKSAGLK